MEIKRGLEEVPEMEMDGKPPCPGWDNRVPFTPPSPGKSISRAIVTRWLPPETFSTPTIQFPHTLAALKAVLPQAQREKSRGWSYLSDSTAERTDNWGEGWRGLPWTLHPGEGWLLGWDEDTAPAAVALRLVRVPGNMVAESKRREITLIRQAIALITDQILMGNTSPKAVVPILSN